MTCCVSVVQKRLHEKVSSNFTCTEMTFILGKTVTPPTPLPKLSKVK